MKQFRMILCMLLTCMLALYPLAGRAAQATAPAESAAPVESAAPEAAESETTAEPEAAIEFSPSDGIDAHGLWEGVTALALVELCEYQGILVPASVHGVGEEAVQEQIDALLEQFATQAQITDRAVADGDTVNIDYVGSVDGVEFDGGSTGGMGTDVTIGVTSYIDDFLEQLVGHMPGETINVEVTFPQDYGVDELNGKDAVFVTTIHYIMEYADPQLTDEFVAENLSQENGWTTVAQMREEIETSIREDAVLTYIGDYIVEHSKASSVPESMIAYQRLSLLSYYQEYATLYGMTLDEFSAAYLGYETADELAASYDEYNLQTATFQLIVQAIAEDLGLSAGEAEVTDYFARHLGVDDHSEYEAYYGAPYLTLVALEQLVMDNLVANAALE